MKMTATKLKVLKIEADLLLLKWNVINEKIRKNCYHPKSCLEEKTYYRTDTLGNNPENVTDVVCKICGNYLV